MSKPSNKNTSSYHDFHIDWKSLFSPCPVDIEAQTPEQVKFARRYNLFFWCAYGALAIAALFMAYPNIVKMIMGPLLMLVFFLAFNASALSENLFHDNPEDLLFLESDEGRRAIIALHVEGIVDYVISK